MIYTSNLPNDQDMIRALGSMAIPIPLFTDACFAGVGADSSSLLIAVERKKISDLVSCIESGRLLFQAAVCKTNGADVLVLIAEGEMRASPADGLLERPVWGIDPKTNKHTRIWIPVKPPMMYSRFDQYLTELDYLAGIMVKRSQDVHETALIIKSLWDNFQTAPSQHNSMKKMFSAPNTTVELLVPSFVRRVAKELPNIGWGRSKDVAEQFKTVHEMCHAGVGEWTAIDGIGKKIAQQAIETLNGAEKK